MSQTPQSQALHYEASWFKNMFTPLSRVIIDTNTKQPVMFLKMALNGSLGGYTDSTKSVQLFDSPRTSHMTLEWDVFDTENQNKQLAHIKSNIMKTILKAGAETWEINDPSGQPFLVFNSDASDSVAKHVMDNFTNLYNPTHQYNLWNAGNKPVARIWTKHGMWKVSYDLVFEEDVSEDERKVVLALFANLVLSLKK